MASCNHRCSECQHHCSSKMPEKAPINRGSSIRHVIGVVSGKGGVGKSLISCLLASVFAKKGYKTGILDADITGPSVPHAFGLSGLQIEGDEFGMIPVESRGGVKMISVNLLVEEESKPVLLRGAAISATVKQFWSDVHWGDLDYLFIDMPPGTGDVPLTVYQNLPLDGIVVVGSPQGLVSMIVKKAIHMAQRMDVKLLGLVENMSYVACPDCGRRMYLYGEGKTRALAESLGVPCLAELPIDPAIALAVDEGRLEEADLSFAEDLFQNLSARLSL